MILYYLKADVSESISSTPETYLVIAAYAHPESLAEYISGLGLTDIAFDKAKEIVKNTKEIADLKAGLAEVLDAGAAFEKYGATVNVVERLNKAIDQFKVIKDESIKAQWEAYVNKIDERIEELQGKKAEEEVLQAKINRSNQSIEAANKTLDGAIEKIEEMHLSPHETEILWPDYSKNDLLEEEQKIEHLNKLNIDIDVVIWNLQLKIGILESKKKGKNDCYS